MRRFQKKFERWKFHQNMCLKVIWCCNFHGQKYFAKESFWLLNTWQAPVQKRIKQTTLNFAHTILTACPIKQNCTCGFSDNESFISIAIIPWVLEVYFVRKWLKVDYWKNIWKEENCGHRFVCSFVEYISVQINN